VTERTLTGADLGPAVAVAQAAERLISAARTGVPAAPVRDVLGSTDVALAYEVQNVLTAARKAAGARVAGRKVGLTSPAVQRQLGVDQPDFGVLFDDMLYPESEAIPMQRLLQPKAEAEVAFVLGADLDDEAIGTKVLIAEIRDTANADVVVARAFEPLTQAVIRQLLDLNIKTVKVIDIKDDDTIIKCLKKDPTHDTDEALKDIYRRLRPGDPPTVTNAKALLKRLFFDPKRYDIGRVGRYKINQKLTINVDLDTRIITNEDIVAATQYVISLRRGEGNRMRAIAGVLTGRHASSSARVG